MAELNALRKASLMVVITLLLIAISWNLAIGATDKKQPKVTRECTVSEVLQRICAAHGIKITLNKSLQNKVPCDLQDEGDVEGIIKDLLPQGNCAIVWKINEKGLSSVDVRFFDSSKSADTAPGNTLNLLPFNLAANRAQIADEKGREEEKVAAGIGHSGGVVVSNPADDRKEGSQNYLPIPMKEEQVAMIPPPPSHKVDLRAISPPPPSLRSSSPILLPFPPQKSDLKVILPFP